MLRHDIHTKLYGLRRLNPIRLPLVRQSLFRPNKPGDWEIPATAKPVGQPPNASAHPGDFETPLPPPPTSRA